MTEPTHPYRPLPADFLTDLFRNPLDPGYADAAARRAGAGPPDPPRRRRRMRVVTVAALVVLGLLLAIAYRQVVAEEPARAQVRAELADQIHQRQAEADRLQQQAEELRDEVARLRDQQLSDPRAARELRDLAAVTGLGRVTGDGVVVRVTDGPPGVDPQTGAPAMDPLARIIDRDLQQIANALWAAGAEAVAINGRRLTATSTIRNAGEAILVDHQPLLAPYRVAAIGPADLRERFAASQVAALLQHLVGEYGIGYELRAERDLTLPAATVPKLQYATPIGGDD